jgi:hypothetical protein
MANIRRSRDPDYYTVTTFGMDENGEAEEGGECLLVPESASAPPAVVGFEGYLQGG